MRRAWLTTPPMNRQIALWFFIACGVARGGIVDSRCVAAILEASDAARNRSADAAAAVALRRLATRVQADYSSRLNVRLGDRLRRVLIGMRVARPRASPALELGVPFLSFRRDVEVYAGSEPSPLAREPGAPAHWVITKWREESRQLGDGVTALDHLARAMERPETVLALFRIFDADANRFLSAIEPRLGAVETSPAREGIRQIRRTIATRRGSSFTYPFDRMSDPPKNVSFVYLRLPFREAGEARVLDLVHVQPERLEPGETYVIVRKL